jgi:hypothetical protein
MTLSKARLAPALRLGVATLSFALTSPGWAAAQPTAEVHLADAPAVDQNRVRAYCDAELRRMKQSPGLGDGQSTTAFLKTCLADVDPVAALPGPADLITAPAGATGVCKDGTYAAAVRRDDACRDHGGLARWFGR